MQMPGRLNCLNRDFQDLGIDRDFRRLPNPGKSFNPVNPGSDNWGIRVNPLNCLNRDSQDLGIDRDFLHLPNPGKSFNPLNPGSDNWESG